MPDTRAFSVRGTGASHDTSCFRTTTRAALMPHVGPIARWESQLRERDPQLHRPPLLADADGRRPHAVPRVVFDDVVRERGVALDARRRDRQRHAGEVVVVGIEIQREPVGVDERVAARTPPRDGRRIAIEQRGPHVERVVVEQDTKVGLLGRRRALEGLDLREWARRRRHPAMRARRAVRR